MAFNGQGLGMLNVLQYMGQSCSIKNLLLKVLLWLSWLRIWWLWFTAVAWVPSLAWKPLHAAGTAKKKKKKEKKKKKSSQNICKNVLPKCPAEKFCALQF